MLRVKVSFYIEADDPDHILGVTEETYDEISEAVMQLGGAEVDFEPAPA